MVSGKLRKILWRKNELKCTFTSQKFSGRKNFGLNRPSDIRALLTGVTEHLSAVFVFVD